MEKDDCLPFQLSRNLPIYFLKNNMKKIKSKLLDKKEIQRTLVRLAHEIIENNDNLDDIVLIGIRTRGEYLAYRLISLIEGSSGKNILSGTLDVTFYRDDFRTNLGSPKIGSSNILCEIEGKTVILIDDVLYTGRTIRAAMDEIFSYGRPSCIQLGVLVDRGHRELPIRADYVGKNYPTSMNEHIHVHLDDVDDEDSVLLVEYLES
jgi:pyrimidine operon attenuation protein/uracil phosphoribosyltransferase